MCKEHCICFSIYQSIYLSESESHSVMSNSLQPHGLYSLWNSPGQNTEMGNHSLLQGIFPIQGSNPSLPHCKKILYWLSHQVSPRILEWVACAFSRESSQPGISPGSPAFQVRSLTAELPGKPPESHCADQWQGNFFLHFHYLFYDFVCYI